jgi:hypothetical protein
MKKTAIHMNIVAAAALSFAGLSVGCDDDEGVVTTTDTAYENAYLYDGYYPADVAYASTYWADSWDLGGFYYLGTGGQVRAGLPGAIRALARGEQICPGQVTVMEKTAAPACAGSVATQVRNGVTIQFNNCNAAGGTINGTIDVQSQRSASEQTCGATTIINLGHTSTFTNLSFTGADGAKIVIPNQTNTGNTNYTFGQNPTMTTIMSNGELQIFNNGGTMLSDHTFMGDNTFTFSGTQSYSVSGTTTIQEKNGGATATLTRTGLTRSAGCCRPTSGSMTINRMGGLFPGQADWSFGPSCGQVERNGASTTMPSCL